MNSAHEFIDAVRKCHEIGRNLGCTFPDKDPAYLAAQREAADAFTRLVQDGFSIESVVEDAARAIPRVAV
ncbi:hypothetical protein [Streptomyces olivaceiscleroticus]|uniref:Uncharacterized protein n=1 Tax=Streptomyces olivaceiscleroticus TaxID=68245 RepID=A0ABN1BMW1_9ACTN